MKKVLKFSQMLTVTGQPDCEYPIFVFEGFPKKIQKFFWGEHWPVEKRGRNYFGDGEQIPAAWPAAIRFKPPGTTNPHDYGVYFFVNKF